MNNSADSYGFNSGFAAIGSVQPVGELGQTCAAVRTEFVEHTACRVQFTAALPPRLGASDCAKMPA